MCQKHRFYYELITEKILYPAEYCTSTRTVRVSRDRDARRVRRGDTIPEVMILRDVAAGYRSISRGSSALGPTVGVQVLYAGVATIRDRTVL